jgi:hypothetical protein
MANLLYKEYKKGCYIGWSSSSGDYEPGDYCYGYGSHLASYYADLKPNTTYTIKRYDTSTRFRIALSSQDLKMLSNTTGTQVTTPFSWGFRADSSDPITFTTGDNDIYLVVYYTNDSEYSTRVMLNEGDTIQEYEAPTKHNLGAVSWFPYPNGYPYNPKTKLLTQTKFKKPYASAIWRIDENNNGNPYTNLLRDIIYAKPTPPPEPGYEEETVVQYDIYCDDKLMHSSVVPENEYKVIDPVLDLQDSAAGSLEFSLPPFNCMYGKCQMMMSTIRVERNGKEIWEGRPVSFKEDMWLNHAITCEGELAYLNDIYQPQNKYENVTLQQLIYAII